MADTSTTHFAESRRIDALVFVDGVEVPFSWLEVSFSADTPSTASIAIEPDPLIDQWRPKSRIHIFIRKPFSTVQPTQADRRQQRDSVVDQQEFMLYWEGELTALRDMESATERATILVCTDLWNIPMNAQLALASIGGGLSVPMISGSTYLAGALDSDGSLLVMVLSNLLSFLFGKKVSNTDVRSALNQSTGDAVKLAGSEETAKAANISDLIRLLLQYLAPYNASYGIQAVNSDLFNKITSIADATLGKFIDEKQAQDLLFLIGGQLSATTVGEFALGVMQKFFHHMVSIPMPVPTKNERGAVGGYRSMAVIPNLYYSIPPFCNWLFPDQYQQRSIDRDFMSEPTRLGLLTALGDVIGDVVHLAPAALSERIAKQIDQAEPVATKTAFGTQNADAAIAGADVENLSTRLRDIGFYAVRPDGTVDTTVNLLSQLTAEEIEKGVLYQQDTAEYQAILARVAANAREDLSKTEGTGDAANKKRLLTYLEQLNTRGTYPYFMRLLAEYQLMFRKLSRRVTVGGVFNPWPVVGLPIMLVRQGRTVRGLLTGLVSRVDYTGQSQTSYEIEYGQLVRPEYLGEDTVRRIEGTTQDIRRAATKVRKAIESTGGTVGTLDSLSDLEDAADVERSRSELVARVSASSAYQYIKQRVNVVSVNLPYSMATVTSVLRIGAQLFSSMSGWAPATPVTNTLAEMVAYELGDLVLTAEDKTVVSRAAVLAGSSSADFADVVRRIGNLLQLCALLYGSAPEVLDSGISQDLRAYTDGTSEEYGLVDWVRTLDSWRSWVATALPASLAIPLEQASPTELFSEDVVTNTFQLAAGVYKVGVVTPIPLSSFYYVPRDYTLFSAMFDVFKDDLLRGGAASTDSSNFLDELRAHMQSTSITVVVRNIGTDLIEATRLAQYLPEASKDIYDIVAAANRSIAETTVDINTRALDIPPVFPFVNQNLTDVSAVDAALENLVRPANEDGRYGTYLTGTQTDAIRDFSQAIGSSNPDVQRDTIIRYDAFLRVVRRVFPLTDDDTSTIYADNKLAGTVHAWANRVQARESVSLQDFLKINSLNLANQAVSSPFGTFYFYQLTDKSASPVYGKASLSSFFARFGAVNPPESNLRRSIREVVDEVAKDEDKRRILSVERQELILAYARKHAAPTVFQGKK